MIYLFLSIVCSSAIFLIFKWFSTYKIHTLSAIVFNYLAAGCLGFLLNSEQFSLEYIGSAKWFPYALFLGSIFIIMFNIMAITTQKLGASVGSIANKMALIIPVIFAMVYYNDDTGILKITGIIVALIGILFSTLKPKTFSESYNKSDLWYPLILLIGSGFIDTYIKYAEEYLLETSVDFQLFSATTFSTAFALGFITLLFQKRKRSFQLQNIGFGIFLGVINFGAIYFLLESFGKTNLESSVVFPINNVGVVLLTTLSSLLLFKEKFSRLNKLGIVISILAVILIAFGR